MDRRVLFVCSAGLQRGVPDAVHRVYFHREAPRHRNDVRTSHQRGLRPGSDVAHPLAGSGGNVVDQAQAMGLRNRRHSQRQRPAVHPCSGCEQCSGHERRANRDIRAAPMGNINRARPCGWSTAVWKYEIHCERTVRKERTMTAKDHSLAGAEFPPKTSNRVGLYSSVLTALITIVTFGFAITAIPISGANCREGCIEYPYLNTVAQFPKDYLWMIPANILMLLYVIWMVSIHAYTAQHKKIFAQIGLAFAMMSALILISDYFIQFSV